MRNIVAGGVGLSVAFALALGACDGETEQPVGGGGSGGTPVETRFDEGSCSYCIEAYCAAQVTGCLADPECASFYTCLAACPLADDGGPDAACEAACPVPTSTAGLAAHQQIQTCRGSDTIKAACSDCPGALPDSQVACLAQGECPADALPDEDNLCVQCMARRCCDTKAAFDASPEANALLDCYILCQTGACFVDCDAMHPDGLILMANFLACASHLCLAQCTDAPPSACDLCTYRTCGDEYAVAQCDDAGALPLTHCVVACNEDATCEAGCYAQYPEQTQSHEAYVQCVLQECAGAGC